jgi:hypothetical protein
MGSSSSASPSRRLNRAQPFQPRTYITPCGFDSKSVTLTGSASEVNIPPCNAPDAPGWTARGISALSGEIQGSGVLAVENSVMWESLYDAAQAFNIRVRYGTVGYRMGSAVLTNLGHTMALASNAKLVQRAVTLSSNGPWPWTAGVPA